MSGPQRIQLSRKKGWRKPEGAVNVARPGRWGNPFTLEWVRLGNPVAGIAAADLTDLQARIAAVSTFKQWLTDDAYATAFPASMQERRAWILQHLHELAGKDLCCWCPPPDEGEADWCHANVLFELAVKTAAQS